ncbi:MAG TPA: phenylacetic acid degradation protein [Lachnospiraceae bacterium]|nr:PaaI family thioesterase [Lachnospiraceae bacterium]HAB93486.1 phenylacetic acid degradation protein [Lachnospiraceae bacterium]
MGTFKTLEEVREHFRNDRFATENGMEVDEFGENYCRCSVRLTERHKNAYGGVMGGVIFTLADFALAVVANNIHCLSVAQQVSINYLSAPKGTVLYADAECIKNGRTTSTIQVKVSDDTGRDVALFVGSVFKLNA